MTKSRTLQCPTVLCMASWHHVIPKLCHLPGMPEISTVPLLMVAIGLFMVAAPKLAEEAGCANYRYI